jgi:membrane protein implicated in regulation of membrane protease activity
MVLPLIPVVAALSTGGNLVAHSAGGLIVYSAASGGYVAGTYISTAALASFLTGGAAVLGAAGTAAIGGAAIWAYGTLGGALASIIGSAGIFGTTIGATGVTGVLMKVGIIPAVPVFVPVAIGVALLAAIALATLAVLRAMSVQRLRHRVLSASDDEELQFSAREAKLVERIIKNVSKPHNWLWRKWMQFFGRKSSRA